MDITKACITKIKSFNIETCFKKLFKIIFFAVLSYVIIHSLARAASASILGAMGSPENFNKLSGTAKYLGEPYRYNYYLDAIEGSYINQGINFFANFLWEISIVITYALILTFNLAFSMDIANLFSDTINSIMASLKTNIFDIYILLAISVGVLYVIVSFLKKNTIQLFSRLGYMAIAMALALMTTIYSGDLVSVITQTSKAIGASSIVAIGSEKDTEVNLEQVSGSLWVTLVHQPWLELESENKLSDEQVETLLRLDRNSDKRDETVKNINDADESIFAEGAGRERVVPALLMLVVSGIKMLIMLAVAIIQVVFQVFTVILMFFLMIILLLSIVPSTGGAKLLGIWAKQVLGFQVGIVLTSFILGFLIKVDQLIASNLSGGKYGWFAITILQVSIYIGVIVFRQQIFEILKKLQNSMSTNIGTQMVQNGVEGAMGAPRSIMNGVSNFSDGMGNFAGKVGSAWGERFGNSSKTENPGLNVDVDHDAKDNPSYNENEDYRSNYESTESAPKLDLQDIDYSYNDQYTNGKIIDVEFDEMDKEHYSNEPKEALGNSDIYSNGIKAIGFNDDQKTSGEFNDYKRVSDSNKPSLDQIKEIDFNNRDNETIKSDKSKSSPNLNPGLDNSMGSNGYDQSYDHRSKENQLPINELDRNIDFSNNISEKKMYEESVSGENPRLSIIDNKENAQDHRSYVGKMIKDDMQNLKANNYGNKESMTKEKISNIESTYEGGAEVQEIDFDRNMVSDNVKGNENFKEITQEKSIDKEVNEKDRNINPISNLKKKTKVNDINNIINDTDNNKNDNISKEIKAINIEKDTNIRPKESKMKEITSEDRANMFSSKTI